MIAATEYAQSWSVFDRLGDVCRVDEALQQSNRYDEFLKKASLLFRKYSVSTTFGVCLLHRHYSCYPDEIALEDYGHARGSVSLATKATLRNEVEFSYHPTVWKYVGQDMVPLEFSRDTCLPSSTHTELGLIPDSFFLELHSLLSTFQFEELLGFCVADRPYYASAPAGFIALEATDHAARSNVVSFCSEALVAGNVIETCWVFAGEVKSNLDCPKVCKLYCYDIDGHKQGHYNIHEAGAKTTESSKMHIEESFSPQMAKGIK